MAIDTGRLTVVGQQDTPIAGWFEIGQLPSTWPGKPLPSSWARRTVALFGPDKFVIAMSIRVTRPLTLGTNGIAMSNLPVHPAVAPVTHQPPCWKLPPGPRLLKNTVLLASFGPTAEATTLPADPACALVGATDSGLDAPAAPTDTPSAAATTVSGTARNSFIPCLPHDGDLDR